MITERPRVGKVMERYFTDLAVVYGPYVRWVEADYITLQENAPEVLLGYRILLAVPTAFRGGLRGQHVTKVVVLDLEGTPPPLGWELGLEDLAWMTATDFPKWERYRVHRGYEPPVERLEY